MSAVFKTALAVRQQVHWSERIAHVVLVLVTLALLVFLAGPLAAILQQSLQDAQGRFAGLANFVAYAKTPALLESLWNSVWVSAVVTVIDGVVRSIALTVISESEGSPALSPARSWSNRM